MKLTLVTINYNGADKTIRLLESLHGQTDQDFQIIIIDNASSDDDMRKLLYYREHGFSAWELVQNSQNLGFSGGNNLGIKKALQNGANWVLLINNDTWVNNGFIGAIKGNLGALEGIVSIPLNEGSRVAYGGIIKWLKSTLPHIYDISKIKYQKSKLYSIGGGLLVYKNVFEKIGMLDERYFLYFEDADFCQRAKRAGVPINILPNIEINHEVSSTTKKLGSPLLLRYHYRNAHLFNWNNGPWYIKLALPFWSFFIIVKQILKLVLHINMPESTDILRGVTDFYFHRFGKIS